MVSSSRFGLAMLVLESLCVSAAAMQIESLFKREATTNATCAPSFIWMNNGNGDTPCQLAADLIAPCHGGNWHIRDLPTNNVRYDSPMGNEAETCTCSWAVYNLISACATCQQKPQAVQGWLDYKLQCPETAISNESYYPIGSNIPGDTKFPSWSIKNPDEWQGKTWNLNEAKALYGSGDVGPPQKPATNASSSSAGPIAGGVVGGVVVVLSAAALAFFLLKRHRKKAGGVRGMAPSDVYSSHYRSQSDTTDKSGFSMGYTNLSSTTGFPPGRSATIRTHNTSIYPFSTFGAPDQATAPQGGAHSPPPITQSPPPATNSASPPHSRQTSATRAEIITPFVLQQPVSDTTSTDRKTPLGNVPRYDSPNAPPTRTEDAILETPQRNRMNPPAYSPHDTPSPMAAGPSRSHLKNGSADTHRTNPSFAGNNAIPQAHVSVSQRGSTSDIYTSPPASASGVPEGTTMTRTGTTATSAFPKDFKRRPTDESLTGRDLA